MNYDLPLVATAITVTCYSWAPSSRDHLFTCCTIYRPPHESLQLFSKLSHLCASSRIVVCWVCWSYSFFLKFVGLLYFYGAK